MADRQAGKDGYSTYTTPVPEGQERRPSAFSDYAGYGGFGGFIDTQEHRTPEYQDAIDTVADSLTERDFHDPRYFQVVRDMAAEHGRPADNAWWDLMDDPEGHAKGWLPQHTAPGQISYDWAYTNDSPFSDGYNELERNVPGWKPDLPDDSPQLPIDRPEDIQHYLGGRVAYEHDMNMERQVSTAKARADEARRRGDAELADYIEGLIEVMGKDAEQGRPETFKKSYWPMVQEEFGDERAGGPNGHITAWVNDPPPQPRHVNHIDRDWDAPDSPLSFDPDQPGPGPLPSDLSREKFQRALAEQQLFERVAPHLAFQAPPTHSPDVVQPDWGKAMKDVADTGGYSIGDASDSPDSGYMISLPDSEEQKPTDTVTPNTEADYRKRNWDTLSQDPDLYQGGWDNDGTFYTDISRNDPDLYRAVGDAVTTNQLGIYDLNQGQTLDTYDDPDDDRDDYNPLMVSPGPVVAFGARVADKTTQERRDQWHNLGKDMLAEVEANGFDHVPGEQFMRDAGHNGLHVREGAHRLVAGGDVAFSQALAELRGVEQRQGAQRLHGPHPGGSVAWQSGQKVPLRHAGQDLVQDRRTDVGGVRGTQAPGTSSATSRRRSAQRLFDQPVLGHTAGQCSGSGDQLDSRFVVALKELLAGPLQPGTDDLAAYEQQQVPTPPRDLPERKRRSLEKNFKQPAKESLDSNMLDDRIDMDTLVKNALSRYHGATPEQVESGKKWYATARARAEELARRTGGDFSKAAAIIASMSPQMEWEGNLNAAAHFMNTYNPASKGDWRRPNLNPQALQAWNDLSGGRVPETPEDFATISKLNGTGDDPDWAKEMAMEGRWGRASGQAGNKRYKYKGAYTGTGLPTLGDNVLRAMQVYDSDDPREILDYAKGGPKIHSFWRNFLGDEDYVTIDKHMLRALDRGYGQDPLLSYGSGKPEVTREMTPEDRRVNQLEQMLGYSRSLKGDEQQSVPTGYNTYAEAIRRATQQANSGMKDPSQHVTPAQMQAIIWVQHKADMDNFRKRKSQEAWEAKNPGKTYAPPGPSKYVPGIPTNGPAPDYYQDDAWADANPYKDGTPRPHVPDFHGITMAPDNIPDPDLGPQDMSVMPAAPWADRAWSQEPEMARAAGRWGRRKQALEYHRGPPLRSEIHERIPSDPQWLGGSEDWYEPHPEADSLPQSKPYAGTWYHVSPHDFAEGDLVTPGHQTTDPGFYNQLGPNNARDDHVWMSPNLGAAMSWAHQLQADNIYEIDPGDKPQKWNFDGVDGYVAPSAKIVRKLTDDGPMGMGATRMTPDGFMSFTGR